MWVRDRGICGFCGEPADPGDWHLDHIVPVVEGGQDHDANRRVAHRVCNQAAGARLAHQRNPGRYGPPIHIRIPRDVYDGVKEIAREEGISFNAALNLIAGAGAAGL